MKFYAASAASALALMSAAAAAPLGFALGDDGATLVKFDAANPMAATTITLSGSLDAIDFRPLNGQLVGYSSDNDAYYSVDVATGALTQLNPTGTATTAGDNVDIDWNPTIDRMRTVADTDENIVFNPLTGGTTVATMLFYGPGDANEGANPSIVANGYTNSFSGATMTTQYVLDSDLNTLGTLANNLGTLTTVGALGLDFTGDAGLDIFFDGVGNIAYALLNVGGLSGLYTINLMTAETSLVGTFSGNLGTLDGLALAPIPVPAGVLLFLTGGAAIAGLRRMRARA